MRTEFVSPVDATVSNFFFEDGATVNEGDIILALECMKMQTYIESPASGSLHYECRLGEMVTQDTILGTIET